MKRQWPCIVPAFALFLVIGCGDEAKGPAAKPAPPASPFTPVADAPKSTLAMPDACTLLDANDVAKAAGWKSARMTPVKTGVEYIAACDYVDAGDAKRVVKLVLAYGAL